MSTKTVERWIVENDKTLNTATWLEYETSSSNRYQVTTLKCKVCTKFVDSIRGSRNFNSAYIEGSSNVRTSAFTDHAKTDMHQRAMILLKKETATDIREYAPIARSLFTMDKEVEGTVKKKFDVAYFIAKEGMAFNKMRPLCHLEERHGVRLGEGYKNDLACSIFVEYIAKDLQEKLKETLYKAKFFNLQMDGSTDCASVEEELLLAVYFDPHSTLGKVSVKSVYFCVRQPKSVDAQGLYDCLNDALTYLEIDRPSRIVGFGCDGTSVNMGDRALKGLIKTDRPWTAVIWCVAHRLELAIKDALNNTLFSEIDEMLMRIYYIYSKAPKKCRELDDVIVELGECLEPSEFPTGGGKRPIRACGTRFIAHKVAALSRIIDKFGAYLSHFTTLTEQPSTKPADKQKLKGYIRKWRESRILLGCAVFHDVLTPTAMLCKVLQCDEVCITSVIESILRTTKKMEKMKATQLKELPSVKKVLLRVREEEDDPCRTYQSVDLAHFDQALTFLSNHYVEYIDSVLTCMRDRLKPTGSSEDVDMLEHILKLLATQGWEKCEDGSFANEAIDILIERFCTPLQDAGVNIALIRNEWDDMVTYAKQYINLVTCSYSEVWWKLFNCPDTVKWSNILSLIELIFSMPLSNGHLERCFSQLKVVKSNRRSCLKQDHLDDLLRIKIEGPPLDEWRSEDAIQLWWQAKTRRVNRGSDTQAPRSSRAPTTIEETPESHEFQLTFDDWDSWLNETETETQSDTS